MECEKCQSVPIPAFFKNKIYDYLYEIFCILWIGIILALKRRVDEAIMNIAKMTRFNKYKRS